MFSVLFGVQYDDIILCIRKPATRNQKDALAIQLSEAVPQDRSALKQHLMGAVLGMADLCRQPTQQLAAQSVDNIIVWCESKAKDIQKTDIFKDEDAPDSYESTVSDADLAWTDKEEQDRNKDIPESEWFEEITRPPFNYVDYTS